MITLLPAYMVAVQYVVTTIGLYEFASAHRLRPSPLAPIKLAIAFLPYQWLLSLGALRATWRQIRGVNNWEKTAHTGAHRSGVESVGVPGARRASLEDPPYASYMSNEPNGPIE